MMMGFSCGSPASAECTYSHRPACRPGAGVPTPDTHSSFPLEGDMIGMFCYNLYCSTLRYYSVEIHRQARWRNSKPLCVFISLPLCHKQRHENYSPHVSLEFGNPSSELQVKSYNSSILKSKIFLLKNSYYAQDIQINHDIQIN